MPNHIHNELTAAPTVLDALQSAEDAIDFEKIVPMPEILRGDVSLTVIDWARIAMGVVNLNTLQEQTPDPLAAFQRGDYGDAVKRLKQSNLIRALTDGPFPKDFSPEDFEKFLQCIRALRETGYPSWYEWSIKYWGTKWNAYETRRVSPSLVKFQTAWSAPLLFFAALAERFPAETLTLRWADEDFGNNVGVVTASDGKVEGGKLTNDSADAHALALDLIHDGVIPDDMVRADDGRLAYREEA